MVQRVHGNVHEGRAIGSKTMNDDPSITSIQLGLGYCVSITILLFVLISVWRLVKRHSVGSRIYEFCLSLSVIILRMSNCSRQFSI